MTILHGHIDTINFSKRNFITELFSSDESDLRCRALFSFEDVKNKDKSLIKRGAFITYDIEKGKITFYRRLTWKDFNINAPSAIADEYYALFEDPPYDN